MLLVPAMVEDSLLSVSGLCVDYAADDGILPVVSGVSFNIGRGRTMALVGESGCGKSVTCYSVLRLIQKPGRIVRGRIVLRPVRAHEIDITSLPENSEQMFAVRGGLVSIIFQEPMSALSPVHTIGDQVAEALLLHRDISKPEARRQCVEILRKVGIPNPEQRYDQYPHQMSGGIRQRVVIAMALVVRPELLIADEPTTALDVTLQAQILDLIRDLQREIACSVLLVTHDLGVVAQMADDVAVMYLGRIVEQGPVRQILRHPRHPYTRGLIQSIPSADTGQRLAAIPGSVPSFSEIPAGCHYHPRCPHSSAGLCDVGSPPPLTSLMAGHEVACLRADELAEVNP